MLSQHNTLMTSPFPPPPPPTFPKQDPATPAFWDARFDAAFTPWDQGGVPKSLSDYVAQNPSPKKVLIPGCGSAHEVRFFTDHQWDVRALDFSSAAVLHARQLLGSLGALVEEADFFGEAIALARFDVIYERAFLCALPRHLWQSWAARVAQLISPDGFLIGFFYFDDSEKGPPFGIAEQRLTQLLVPYFSLVQNHLPADSIPIFAGKERWQVWQRRH